MIPDYPRLLEKVIANGRVLKSRNGPTYESERPVDVHFQAGELFRRPQMSRQLGWMEVLQTLGGFFDNALLKATAPGLMWDYEEETSYGPQWGRQFPKLAAQLGYHPNTRRATVFFGGEANAGEMTKPCASMGQFLLRDNRRLNFSVYMRSWDLVSGFMYDTMVFSAMTMALANVIGARANRVHVRAGSGHIYTKDVEAGRTRAWEHYNRFFRFDLPSLTPTLFMTLAENTARTYPWEKTEFGHVPPGIEVYRD
jgi:hypothetical protein